MADLPPILADVLRDRAQANRERIGLGNVGADVLRSGPPIYQAMSDPRFAQAIADAPALLGYAQQPSFGGMMDVLGVGQRAMNETPMGAALQLLGLGTVPQAEPVLARLGQALGEEAGILRGPAAYAIRRASPPLGRYLERRPEMIYARFGDPTPSLMPGMTATGETTLLGPEEARLRSFVHDFVGSLRGQPTLSAVKSGAIERHQPFPNPYRPPLPRPLDAGDIQITLDRALFDPTQFRQSPKTHAVLEQQRETAIHEGLHAAFLARLSQEERQLIGGIAERFRAGQTLSPVEESTLRAALPSGNIPIDAVLQRYPGQRTAVFDWLGKLDYDFLQMLPGVGTHDLGHAMLSSAAKQAAIRPGAMRRGRVNESMLRREAEAGGLEGVR